jgi:SAM-dependent methyltransferase/uncharacterized protein YbaR (Trm112 family)
MFDRQLSPWARQRLRCPICHARLEEQRTQFRCTGPDCGGVFPIVDGIPVLLNEAQSVFATDDFRQRRDTTARLERSSMDKLLDGLLNRLPALGESWQSERSYARFRQAVLERTSSPRLLVVGGSILGQGMQALATDPAFECIATDVSFGPLTSLVCDAHDIPFEDGSFDAVVVQAVLEHVMDPGRCVEEIHRVLGDRGLVYAETPFIQQVHMGRYDFTRYTHSGHRRLFRQFEEIESGAVGGPGMALAWSYQYFLLSFASSRAVRGALRAFAQVTSFPLKYVDRLLMDKPGTVDAASGFFFIGRKSATTLSDRELTRYYRGALSH